MAELDRHKGALDLEHEEFLFLSMRELLTEFSGTPETPSEQAAELLASEADE